MTRCDRYGVVGHPIGQTRTPEIHALFAESTRQDMSYERFEAPLDGFEEFALGLRDSGYLGLNVMIPFKLDAAKLASDLSPRARLAGTVNTLKFDDDAIIGDNTDGIGFVRDVTVRMGTRIAGSAVLILGASGAVRGLIGPLLEETPKWIAVANRSAGRAQELAEEFGVEAIEFDEVPAEQFDIIINGMSIGPAPAVDPEAFGGCALAYDLSCAPEPTPFMRLARQGGARAIADGLGMQIEQAAESFFLWRGVRPETDRAFQALRRILEGAAAVR